jgi:hypothetical protein
MRRYFFASLVLACAGATQALAGVRFDPVSVHPQTPQRGKAVLIKVESFWPNGCAGTLRVTADAGRVDVIADSSASADRICSALAVPILELINPADFLPADVRFSDAVEVRYLTRESQSAAPLVLDTDTIAFSDQKPAATALPSGSFSSPQLEFSGLSIDQQEGTLSTLLSDYDLAGDGGWRFGAGQLHGDVYVGELARYQKITCIRAPCPRAAIAETGSMNLLVLNPNALLVSYRDVLETGLPSTVQYERMVFNRPANLPRPGDEDSWVPDLSGLWLAGVLGNAGTPPDIRRFRISYLGEVAVDAGINRRHYSAQSDSIRSDDFEIVCSDERPVDGVIGCQIKGFRALEGQCDSFFAPSDVVLGALRAAGTCTGSRGDIDTEFFLQRLER